MAWLSCEHAAAAVTGHETRREEREVKPINQSINQSISHQLLEANRYMTLQSPISIIQKAHQFFPSRESIRLSKNPACNLVPWESKTRVNKVSPIPANAELGKMLEEKKKENAQD
jgi:hypothetical protein